MAKNKKLMRLLPFPKAFWWRTLISTAIGVASQRIPQIRAYTDEIIQPIEHQFSYSHPYTHVIGLVQNYYSKNGKAAGMILNIQ